jgi:putative cell wall-binding protein
VYVICDPPLSDAFNGWRTKITSVRMLPLEPGTVYFTWDDPEGHWQPASGEIIAPLGKHTLYTRIVRPDKTATDVTLTPVKTDPRATGRPLTGGAKSIADGDPVGGISLVRVTATINPTAGARLIRLGGASRYETAARISQDAFDQADTVILATGTQFADALAAAGLAGCVRGPVLLTDPGKLSGAAISEIVRLKAKRVIIVGGTAAVSQGVTDTLRARGLTVERLGGSNRYETATLIGYRVLSYGQSGGRVFVARGDDFADALALGPMAYRARAPLVLVTPKTVPPATRSFLNANHFSSGCIAGGTVAVSSGVAGTVDGYVGDVTRLAGASRYGTAVAVASWGVRNDLASWDAIGVATGTNFADALCGGVAIGEAGGVVLLTLPGQLPPDTLQSFGGAVSIVMDTQVYGGERAIYPTVFSNLANLLR